MFSPVRAAATGEDHLGNGARNKAARPTYEFTCRSRTLGIWFRLAEAASMLWRNCVETNRRIQCAQASRSLSLSDWLCHRLSRRLMPIAAAPLVGGAMITQVAYGCGAGMTCVLGGYCPPCAPRAPPAGIPDRAAITATATIENLAVTAGDARGRGASRRSLISALQSRSPAPRSPYRPPSANRSAVRRSSPDRPG